MFVRVRIPGVGEWSQPADKPLREDVGEELVSGSEHDAPYRDHPEPPDDLRPLPNAPAAEPAADPSADVASGKKSSKGA